MPKTLKAIKTQNGWEVTITETNKLNLYAKNDLQIKKWLENRNYKITSKYSSKATKGMYQVVTAEKE